MNTSREQINDNPVDLKLIQQQSRRRSRSMTPLGKATTSTDINANVSGGGLKSNFRGSVRHLQQVHTTEKEIRKTTAEIISEAKTQLLGTASGVRLVTTRRPITPRDPRRQLYGKAAPPGRPPSAFSLQYLQSEVRNLPSLEHIQNSIPDKDHTLRSQALAARMDSFDSKLQRKLPALSQKVQTPPNQDSQACNSPELVDVNHNTGGLKNDTLSKSIEVPSPDDAVLGEKFMVKPSTGSIISLPRKLHTRNRDLLAQSSTETLTAMLKQHAGIKDCTEETVQHIHAILSELYYRIGTIQGTCRSTTLGALYGLVECSSPKILLAVARAVLGLRVTGSNLTGACKLIFKVARNETNDYLFHETDVPELLIDGLGRASPIDEPEACVYGYGAVRFLTSVSQRERISNYIDLNSKEKFWDINTELPPKPSTAPEKNIGTKGKKLRNKRQQISIAQRLAKHGAIQLMVLQLQILNEAGSINKLSGPTLHSLYQLSAAIRALAGAEQSSTDDRSKARPQSARSFNDKETPQLMDDNDFDDFVHLELACPHLIKAAEISIGEFEIQANVVRTLSVLSDDPKCCRVLSDFSGKIGMLLGPCPPKFTAESEKRMTVLNRLGYVLGNIMAKYDEARKQFYHNDVAMEYLYCGIKCYSEQDLTLHNQMGDSVADVLTKLIRVLANMSVNLEIGHGLGRKTKLGEIFLNLLRDLNLKKNENMGPEVSELFNVTLGAMHNVCFYQNKFFQGEVYFGSICNILTELCVVLCAILREPHGQELARVEAARVLGNLTRNPEARSAFTKAHGLKIVIHYLDSPNHQILTSAIGILVNILGDWQNRQPFLELKGHFKLMDMLKKFLQQRDWLVAGIICHALWNLFIDTEDIENMIGPELTYDLSDTIADYLDERTLFRGAIPDSIWEQFALVATDILEKIQCASKSPFEPFDFHVPESDEDDVHIEEMSIDKGD